MRDATLLQQLQSLGFSLKEIGEVLAAMRAKSIDCAQDALLMAQKRAAVDAQIAQLRQVSKVLAREQQRLQERPAQHLQGKAPAPAPASGPGPGSNRPR